MAAWTLTLLEPVALSIRSETAGHDCKHLFFSAAEEVPEV